MQGALCISRLRDEVALKNTSIGKSLPWDYNSGSIPGGWWNRQSTWTCPHNRRGSRGADWWGPKSSRCCPPSIGLCIPLIPLCFHFLWCRHKPLKKVLINIWLSEPLHNSSKGEVKCHQSIVLSRKMVKLIVFENVSFDISRQNGPKKFSSLRSQCCKIMWHVIWIEEM